ncbi:PspC domain-containing protein [Dinghuibacter silviterrae]|uniref:Phage shock protein C (PspC) family protein n=1 Tax=Dinghuibacter silviterrae TaxID=1539049 RepID=A0A4R8DPN3_9BACT|nr:PspC domain-containing protein [Dinghuibacter silviterrae]TDW99677.1 phage shock protein C (PspC) family protein [Dinghuibacter silviterrae]
MKKVININFQGRVIPIEESAFELLKQYIESLRRYFANEEGREEIINDIQDRIGELFNDYLKGGATCITDEDLGRIIDNMGRPEDFEAAENSFAEQMGANQGAGAGKTGTGAGKTGTGAGTAGMGSTEKTAGGHFTGGQYEPRGRLYRNESDKVLGGVCSGLANYLKIDPVIIRILYVIMVFGSFGAAVLVYFVLWIALPTQAMEANIRKRLFRNPEDRMIGGVCGGIAAYFNIEVWIPRLIFAAPFLLGVVGAIGRVAFWWWHWHDFSYTVFNGFGGSLLLVYIILWAVLPEARTASERLEMRGAKIDLESIRATVQQELQGIKERAVKAGGEFSERAQAMGEELKSTSRRFAKEAAPAARRTGSGVLRAIGMLFKIFFMFIAGIIAFSILASLIAVLFGSVGAYTLSDIFLQGFWAHFFFWATLVLFLGIPVVAIFYWIIRMITGRKADNYIRYVFGSLWFLGFVSAFCLAGMIVRSVRDGNAVTDQASIAQPSHNKMIVRVKNQSFGNDSWNWGVHMDGFMEAGDDNLLHIYDVRLNLGQSPDGDYHVAIRKRSRGNDPEDARSKAEQINYSFQQEDSILYLSRTFTLGQDERYRGQGVYVNLSVPVGKHIFLDESVDRLSEYKVRIWKNKWDNNNVDMDDGDYSNEDWETGVDYIMTKDGLVRADGKKITHDSDDDNNDDGDKPEATEKQEKTEKPEKPDTANPNHEYRYHPAAPQTPKAPAKSKADTAVQASISRRDTGSLPDNDNITSRFYHISCAL